MFHIETSLEPYGVKRTQFNKSFIEQGARLMDDWDGYVLSPKSFQTIKITVPFEEGASCKLSNPSLSVSNDSGTSSTRP